MKAPKKVPSLILAGLIALVLMPQLVLAADHSVSTPEDLTAALGTAADGDTIRLAADIDYTTGISISGKTITFDLNGYTLNVTNSLDDGLYVGSGGIVNLTGSGAFNVSSSAADRYGVNAENGGRATVTNAASTGPSGVGAHAFGTNSNVHVMGNATSADNIGALARNHGTVIVDGNAEGGIIGADAVGTDTLVEVAGNAIGSVGVSCALDAAVTVDGSVTATGNESTPYAITIAFGGTISVGGNVTASGTGITGAQIYDGGTITIDGTLVAPIYISLQDVVKNVADGVPGTAPYEDYLIYTDGSNTVRVGHLAGPSISPTDISFDKNPTGLADASTAITWNNAASVTDVKADGASIGAENYSISGSTLIIKKEYLLEQPTGSLELSVEFDIGDPIALTVAISDSTPVTGLPDKLTLYVGGRVTWDPSPKGGSWDWDEDYLSADASGSAVTFTALKAGTLPVTYSANGVSHTVTVTVREAELPVTGQDDTLAWVLGSLSIICALAAAFMVRVKMKSNP